MNEIISQLVDQQLDSSQRKVVFDRIYDDKSANKSWRHYHLIGNVIRNEISSTGTDLCGKIQLKLENEPTVLAPLRITNTKSSNSQEIWKSVGLFAIAASLALVAVITLAPVEFDGTDNQLTAVVETPDASEAIQFSQEFDEMLVEHAEFTASSGLNGLIAYAKLVSNQQLEQ